MSLTKAKMGANKGSLKAQLEQEERDLAVEMEAVEKDKARASKKEVKGKKED